MNAIQARAARYALRLTAKEAAKGSGVSDFTIKHFEKGEGMSFPETVEALKGYYCSLGVRFIEGENEHGVIFGPDTQSMPPRTYSTRGNPK